MGVNISADSSQPNKGDKQNKEITESRLVVISGVRNTDNKDTLKKRLENALKRPDSVVKIVYGSSSDKVIVIFRNQVNPKFLEKLLAKQSLDYKFESIKEPTVVQVLDIPPGKKYLEAVKLYLRNIAKSGGTKEADFYGDPDPTCGYCLIDLKVPEVVNGVCERTHTIVGEKESRILPYYDHLGIAVNLEERPNDLISDKLVLKGMDAEVLKFILEKMEIEFQHFMKAHRIILVDQSLNSLIFSPNLNADFSASDEAAVVVIGPEWKAKVEKAFIGEFLPQLHVERLVIKDERKWRYLQKTKEELCRETQAINVYEDSCPCTFKFVCRKTDEHSLKSLKVKIESKEPPEEYVTDIMDKSSSMKLRAFEVLGFKDDIESKNQVELKIHVNDGKIELIGTKKNNQEAKNEIAKKLASLEEKTCSPPNADYLEILKSPQLIEQSNREIEKNNLRGIWEIDGVSQKMSICYEDSQKNTFREIKKLIFGLLDTDDIAIDGDMDHESLDRLRFEIRDIENSLEPFAHVKLQEDSKNVRITCRKDLMVECRQKLQDFIHVHLICTYEISMKAAIADYIHGVMQSQIEEGLEEACGTIATWNFNDSKFYVTGNQIVHSKCTEILYMLASKVIVTWRPIERKGIQKYFTIGSGRDMESQVPNSANCHLKILGKDEFQKQKIRAVALTEEGQAIGIGVMDLYKQPVDGIVNVMNEDFEEFSKGGVEVEIEISNYIKANGKLTEAQVFITGPGKLPCLKILHAVAPKWRGGTENEDETLEKTIENILSTAELKSLRSIAMPIVSCRALFGYPVRRASRDFGRLTEERFGDTIIHIFGTMSLEILLQTIIKLCPTKFKSINEIYICDTDSTKIQTFQRLAEDMFMSQCFSIPMGQNLTFGKTIAQTPNKKLTEGWQTIVQRRGIRKIPLPAGRKIIIAWGDLAKLSDCTPPLKVKDSEDGSHMQRHYHSVD